MAVAARSPADYLRLSKKQYCATLMDGNGEFLAVGLLMAIHIDLLWKKVAHE